MLKGLFIALLVIVIGFNLFYFVKALSIKSLISTSTKICNLLSIAGMGMYLFFILAVEEPAAQAAFSFFTGTISMILLAFLNFVYIYTHDEGMPRKAFVALLLPMVIDALSNYLNPVFHHQYNLMLTEVRTLSIFAISKVYPPYYFHLILCYVISFLILGFLIWKIKKTSSFFRRKYVIVAILFILVVLLDAAFFLLDLAYNISILFYGVVAIAITLYSLFIAPNDLLNNMLSVVVKDLNTGLLFFDSHAKCIYSNKRVWDMFDKKNPNLIKAEKIFAETLKNHTFDENNQSTWNDSYSRNGNTIYVSVTARQLYDTTKSYIGCYISITDMTESVRNYERQLSVIQESAKMKSKFLSQVSHELRTPINSIYGMNEMIQRECKDPVILDYSNDIRNSSELLNNLINDILDLSKLEAGKMTIVEGTYDVKSQLTGIINMMSIRANEKQLDFKLDIDPDIPTGLYGDSLRIQQVLLNLLSNAVKYTAKGSVTLSVKCELIDDVANIHYKVSDTGIGIKKEDIPLLFDAYRRFEDDYTHNIQGTGLGLTITLQLLSLMDSTLNVESTPGAGSSFSFSILQEITDTTPIGDFSHYRNKPIFNNNAQSQPPEKESRVLVVDDNAINRKVFTSLLKNTGLNVTGASSGAECIELAQKEHFDIIFLDHQMPEMDGIETFNKLKSRDNACINSFFVMLTANSGSELKSYYQQIGFDDFLSKPIVPEALDEIIQKYIR